MLKMVATIAIDQQQRLRKRQLQGFGVGVGLGTAAPAPFIPEPEDLLTYSPTPQPSNAATLQSSAPPTSIEPTAMPSIRYPPSPPPTNLSTGGAVAVIGGMDETVDLPYQLNFHVEFQMLTEDFGAATDEMKDFLSAYLTTMELSMDAEHTEGPLQVVGLDVTTQGNVQFCHKGVILRFNPLQEHVPQPLRSLCARRCGLPYHAK